MLQRHFFTLLYHDVNKNIGDTEVSCTFFKTDSGAYYLKMLKIPLAMDICRAI